MKTFLSGYFRHLFKRWKITKIDLWSLKVDLNQKTISVDKIRIHQYLWRKMESVDIGDKFEMLVTQIKKQLIIEQFDFI